MPMSEINITNYIKSLGLSGAEADAKRAELTALSNAELTQLISGTGKTTSKGTTIETRTQRKKYNPRLRSPHSNKRRQNKILRSRWHRIKRIILPTKRRYNRC